MARRMVVAVEHDEAQRVLLECAFRECSVDLDLRIFSGGGDLFEFLLPPGGKASLTGNVTLAILSPGNLGMRSENVLQHLRANRETAFLPVAVLGEPCYEEEVQFAYQHGANAYLVKPVKFEDYTATLRDTLKFWGRNHLARARQVE